MTPDDFERWGKHLPGLLRKDFGLYVDVRNAAADEIERLRTRIAELEAERGQATRLLEQWRTSAIAHGWHGLLLRETERALTRTDTEDE